MNFCFRYGQVASTLIGMASKAQVEACLSSFRSASDHDLLAEIRETIADEFNYVWASGRQESEAVG